MESIQNLRILSQIFSPNMFKKIIRGQDTLFFNKKINKRFHSQKTSNLNIIKTIYKALQKDYRCEYIYKNNLLLDIINKHCLDETLMLNELKIGSLFLFSTMIPILVLTYSILSFCAYFSSVTIYTLSANF